MARFLKIMRLLNTTSLKQGGSHQYVTFCFEVYHLVDGNGEKGPFLSPWCVRDANHSFFMEHNHRPWPGPDEMLCSMCESQYANCLGQENNCSYIAFHLVFDGTTGNIGRRNF